MDNNRKLPLKRQDKDERDFMCYAQKKVDLSGLPSRVDLREKCPPIFNQGNLGSCTANAYVAFFMMLASNLINNVSDEYARLYLYFKSREAEGTINEDSGATMRTPCKILKNIGVCKEGLWEYIEDKFADTPTLDADENAKENKIKSFKALSGLNQIKKWISENQAPVAIGIDVYDSFMSDEVGKSGVIPIPNKNKESLNGGHAVLVVGYDDNLSFNKSTSSNGIISTLVKKICPKSNCGNGYLIMRNSWGKDWGDEGYFYLPYKFLDKFAYDFWIIE